MAIKTLIDESRLKEDITLSENQLEDQMMTQAELSNYYGVLAAKAEFQFDRMKNKLSLVEARLDGQYRMKFSEDGVKVTEKIIASHVEADDEYQEAIKDMHTARYILNACKAAKDSFAQRRDMIVQLNKNKQLEMQGDLFFKSIEDGSDIKKQKIMEILKTS